MRTIGNEFFAAERFILGLLEPTGLDWNTTAKTFMDRYGLSDRSDDGYVGSIYLPPITTFSKTPLQFTIPYKINTEENRFPPCNVTAYFNPTSDSLENHRRLLEELEIVLGEGLTNNSAKYQSQEWTFGIFSISVTTQEADSSALRIKTPYAHIYPDERLSAIQELDEESKLIISSSDPYFRTHFNSLPFTYRNPIALTKSFPLASSIFWKNTSTDEFGLSESTTSLVFESRNVERITIKRVRSARSGTGEMSLYLTFKQNDDWHRPVHIFSADSSRPLDKLVDRIGDCWDLKVIEEEAMFD